MSFKQSSQASKYFGKSSGDQELELESLKSNGTIKERKWFTPKQLPLPTLEELNQADKWMNSAKSSLPKTVSKGKSLKVDKDPSLGKRTENDLVELNDLDEDLAGSDFNSVSQYLEYQSKPDKGPSLELYNRMMNVDQVDPTSNKVDRPQEEFFSVEQDVYQIAEPIFQDLKRFVDNKYDESKNNTVGYSLILGADKILAFARSRPRSTNSVASLVYLFENDHDTDYDKFWRFIKAIPVFIGFLFGDGLVSRMNSATRAQMRVIEDSYGGSKVGYEANEAWKSLAKALIKINPVEGFTCIWSLEGRAKYLATQDLKYLHVHLLLIRPNGTVIGTPRVLKVIASLVAMFDSLMGKGSVTVAGVRSKNQLFYIGKEKVLVGITFPVPQEMVSKYSSGALELDDYSYSLMFLDTRDHNWKYLFERVIKHFSEVSTYTGVSCIACDQFGGDDKVTFCASWGWDESVLRHLRVNAVEPFASMFKVNPRGGGGQSFDDWLTVQNQSREFCARRVLEMARFRGVLLARALAKLGLDAGQISMFMMRLTEIFYRFTHDPKNVAPYQAAREFIKVNFFNPSLDWIQVLVLGGPGSSGKSTFARCLHSGLGLQSRSVRLQTGNQIGRDSVDPLTLMRFYDEVNNKGSGRTNQQGANIFFSFMDVEKAQTVLYEKNPAKKGKEFVVAASANIRGFPNYAQFESYHGTGHSNQYKYAEWKQQALRRFRVIVFEVRFGLVRDQKLFCFHTVGFFMESIRMFCQIVFRFLNLGFLFLASRFESFRILSQDPEIQLSGSEAMRSVAERLAFPPGHDLEGFSVPVLAGVSTGDLYAPLGSGVLSLLDLVKGYFWGLVWSEPCFGARDQVDSTVSEIPDRELD